MCVNLYIFVWFVGLCVYYLHKHTFWARKPGIRIRVTSASEHNRKREESRTWPHTRKNKFLKSTQNAWEPSFIIFGIFPWFQNLVSPLQTHLNWWWMSTNWGIKVHQNSGNVLRCGSEGDLTRYAQHAVFIYSMLPWV